MLTTFYLARNDHRWVTLISLKTITYLIGTAEKGPLDAALGEPFRIGGLVAERGARRKGRGRWLQILESKYFNIHFDFAD